MLLGPESPCSRVSSLHPGASLHSEAVQRALRALAHGNSTGIAQRAEPRLPWGKLPAIGIKTFCFEAGFARQTQTPRGFALGHWVCTTLQNSACCLQCRPDHTRPLFYEPHRTSGASRSPSTLELYLNLYTRHTRPLFHEPHRASAFGRRVTFSWAQSARLASLQSQPPPKSPQLSA